MREINVNEIERIVEPTIIDVREDYELEETGTLKGAIHIPMDEIPDRLKEIPKDREIYVLCRSGVRSYNVAKYLEERGYSIERAYQGSEDGEAIIYKAEEDDDWHFLTHLDPSFLELDVKELIDEII